MPKLNLYQLGAGGVNVDSNDLHVKDDELRACQNWMWDPAGTAGGLRKRDGIAKLNSSAMSGAVKGLIGLPLVDHSGETEYIYAPYDDDGAGSNTWHRSTDGTTWASVTTGNKSQQRNDCGAHLGTQQGAMIGQICTHNRKIYHPGRADGTNPTINQFDGTTDVVMTTIPPNPNAPSTTPLCITFITPYDDTRLVVGTYDTTAVYSRVFLFNTRTGAMTQVGQETTLPQIAALAIVFQGKIFIILNDDSGGTAATVRWARPEDAAWTVSDTAPAAVLGFGTGLCIFKGNLYASYASGTSTQGVIRKFDVTAGTWSTSYSVSGSPTGANNVGPMIVNADDSEMYAFQYNGAGTPNADILASSDGTTFASDHDLGTGAAVTAAGQPFRHPTSGKIFWTIMGATHAQNAQIVENNAGTYTQRDSSEFLRGPFAWLGI